MATKDSGAHAKGPIGVVMGYRLPRARLTARGWIFIALVFGLPVLGAGLVLDVLLQWILGRCLGVWCWF